MFFLTVVMILDLVVASLLTLRRLAVIVSLPLLLWLEVVAAVVALVVGAAVVAVVDFVAVVSLAVVVVVSLTVVVAGVSTLT